MLYGVLGFSSSRVLLAAGRRSAARCTSLQQQKPATSCFMPFPPTTRLLGTATQTSAGSDDSSSSSFTAAKHIPRGAVSVCVRCRVRQHHQQHSKDFFMMVQRGREPNKGQWSLAGGKLEWQETALDGAVRELQEETVWDADDWAALRWYPGTVCTTDAIGPGYHYLIAHCFAELTLTFDDEEGRNYLGSTPQNEESSSNALDSGSTAAAATSDDDEKLASMRRLLPKLGAADDAAAVDWWQWHEIQDKIAREEATPSVDTVVARMQALSQHGLLPTEPLASISTGET